jgi:hypothetical protein
MDLLTIYSHHSKLQALNSAIADFHTLQTTTAPAKPFPAYHIFTSRSLATASISGDSSVSRNQILLLTVNSTIAPSLLSLTCRVQLKWLPQFFSL